jgi:hypothetical protein
MTDFKSQRDLAHLCEELQQKNDILQDNLQFERQKFLSEKNELTQRLTLIQIENQELRHQITNSKQTEQELSTRVVSLQSKLAGKDLVESNLRELHRQDEVEKGKLSEDVSSAEQLIIASLRKYCNHRYLSEYNHDFKLQNTTPLSMDLERLLTIQETILCALEERTLLLENNLKQSLQTYTTEIETVRLEKMNTTIKLQVSLIKLPSH